MQLGCGTLLLFFFLPSCLSSCFFFASVFPFLSSLLLFHEENNYKKFNCKAFLHQSFLFTGWNWVQCSGPIQAPAQSKSQRFCRWKSYILKATLNFKVATLFKVFFCQQGIVSVAISSYTHTAEEPEEEPEEVIPLHELPLKTWTIWVRWWHLTAVALPLVFKQKAFDVIGASLRRETHAVGVFV